MKQKQDVINPQIMDICVSQMKQKQRQ